jgi:hypothetical protein
LDAALVSEGVVEAAWSGDEVRAGDFDHAAWSRAAGVSIGRYWSGEEAPPEKRAEARLVWCDRGLVVRFVCRQAGPPVVAAAPRLDRKTVGLWERDVCEIFVAPDAARPERYFEFEAAPTGEWLDLAVLWSPDGRATDWEYQSGMETAARLSGDVLTVAMRLPWAAFGRVPAAGERWRCNLFRCAGADPLFRYLAWLPTHTPEPQFHVPEKFGTLVFGRPGATAGATSRGTSRRRA